jgi:aldose 1-epimerase
MAKPIITCTPAESRINGEEVFLFEVSNDSLKVTFTNYSCTIISILAPDKNGDKKNIVSGFNSNEDAAGVAFAYTSDDMEEGYPGAMDVTVTYLLNRNNELILQYEATCDQPTIVNLTNHTYFNLSGFGEATIYEHLLKINAACYTKKNEHNVPSGEICRVENTPFDFKEYKKVGENIKELVVDKGYDHNFVLQHASNEVSLAATLYDPVSGRLLEVLTNQPGIQVYTANWWDGSITGAQGVPYVQHGAIALETQNFPDAPNHPNFPTAILSPGEFYNRTTIYRMGTM